VLYPHLTPKAGFERNFGKIYAGNLATEGQFPFIAHLLTARNDGNYVCGSSILDAGVLVTAAHCVEDVNLITAVAGSVNWRQLSANGQERTSSPENFDYHEDFIFNDDVIGSDIGYIKLDEPFDITEFVQPIAIADNEPQIGDLVSAIGWGKTENLGGAAEVLSYVNDLEIVNDDVVDDYFGEGFIHEHFICTYQRTGGTCGGDSGGPIVDANDNLVGAVSFGGQFCTISPSCYTSVVYFKDWLRNNAGVDI